MLGRDTWRSLREENENQLAGQSVWREGKERGADSGRSHLTQCPPLLRDVSDVQERVARGFLGEVQ